MSVNGVAVLTTIVSLFVFSMTAVVPTAQGADAAATAVLKRARLWAGEAALANVQSISIATHRENVGVFTLYRLRWPDKLQTLYGQEPGFAGKRPETLEGHTLDGAIFWQRFARPVLAEHAARAKRGSLSNLVNIAVTYLLRPPVRPDVSVKALGHRSILALEGDALLVTDPNKLFNVYIFDPKTGGLIGYVQNTKADGHPTGPTDHRVERFSDFRDVEGVKFPFRIEETWDAPAGTTPRVTIRGVDQIELNRLNASDFKQVK